MDGATRQAHAELHGQAWRHDDPIWDAIYPPNGFNCRCRVQALAEEEAERRGAKPNPPGPRPRSAESRPVSDTPLDATGELPARPVKRVWWTGPDGARRSFSPDPGWGYNPGAHAMPPPKPGMAKAAAGQPDWRTLGMAPMRPPPGRTAPDPLPAAPNRAAAREAAAEALGLAGDAKWRRIDTPAGPVALRRSMIAHIVAKPEDARERFANRILPTLQDPDEVWMTYYDNGQIRMRYLKAWSGRGGGMAVAEDTREGLVLWNFIPMRAKDLNSQRVGWLVHAADRDGKG